MNPDEIAVLRDAIHCLLDYHSYGEDMRNIGKGYHPTGLKGHNVRAVILGIKNMLDGHTHPDGKPDMSRYNLANDKTNGGRETVAAYNRISDEWRKEYAPAGKVSRE